MEPDRNPIEAARDEATGRNGAGLSEAAEVAQRVAARLGEAIVGRDDVIDLVVVAWLAGGHVLLEDFPGSGKTMLARALGESLDGDGSPLSAFRRIQFTPDLLPSDITGVSVFDPEHARFEFVPGPVFAHVVLADEINRTSPKVQSALLEAMAERQVTVDNVTYPLDPLFLVVATQNPLGLAGTFPLPAPQLDRFLFKIRMVPIARSAELEVVASYRQRLHPQPSSRPKITRDELLAARDAVEREVHFAAELRVCLVDLARATRDDPRVAQGLSTRSLVQAVPALQARAMRRGRTFVSTDDLATLAVPLFAHRIVLAPGVADPVPIVSDALAGPLEAATRATLQRG